MSNGNVFERILKLWTKICVLMLEGKRDPERIANVLQESLSEKTWQFSLMPMFDVVITVPSDYVHESRLGVFRRRYGRKLRFCNPEITDEKFSQPARILQPGAKLRVRVVMPGPWAKITPMDRVGFLTVHEAVYPGAQGASLVWGQYPDLFRKGHYYASFDQAGEAAQKSAPCFLVCKNGPVDFDLGYFGHTLEKRKDSCCFFLFEELTFEELAVYEISSTTTAA